MQAFMVDFGEALMVFLGIEVGGTKLQIGIGDGAGQVWHLWRARVGAESGHVAGPPVGGAEAVRQQLLHGLRQLLQQAGLAWHDITAIGVGFGGPVDDSRGVVLESFQVPGWAGFPLREWLMEQTGRPVTVCNDAATAALAEAHFGAGRGFSPMFYSNVGSGIGGALVVGGRVYRGSGRGAGEIGHLWIDYQLGSATPDPTTWRDLEAGSSGWAIARTVSACCGEPCSVEDALRRLDQGDLRIAAIWHHALHRIALALSHVIALLAPKRIVLGGGVSLAGERFFAPLREALARIAFPPLADCDVVPAALGETVVVHGALLLARAGLRPLTVPS
jgi:glucokinase